LRFDGAAMRQLGINGEVALVHEGWRRDAVGLVVTGGVIFLATLTHPKWDTVEATGVVSRHFSPISMDDMALLFLAAVGAWLGVKRLKDRRFAEVLAAARRRKELGMPARPHQGDYSHGDK
jgi:hypothetical protein